MIASLRNARQIKNIIQGITADEFHPTRAPRFGARQRVGHAPTLEANEIAFRPIRAGAGEKLIGPLKCRY